MASAPQLIFTDNPGDLAATYQLPQSLNFAISSVFAKIDGSGASGSFLPCLSVYSQDGHLMARVPVDTTYTAGDTGDCTWSPFVRSAGAPTSDVVLPYAWGSVSGAGTLTSGSYAYCGLDFVQTTDTATFGHPTFSSYFDTTNSTQGSIELIREGIYLIVADILTDTSAYGAGQSIVFATATRTATGTYILQMNAGSQGGITSQASNATTRYSPMWNVITLHAGEADAPHYVKPYIQIGTPNNIDVFGYALSIYRIASASALTTI